MFFDHPFAATPPQAFSSACNRLPVYKCAYVDFSDLTYIQILTYLIQNLTCLVISLCCIATFSLALFLLSLILLSTRYNNNGFSYVACKGFQPARCPGTQGEYQFIIHCMLFLHSLITVISYYHCLGTLTYKVIYYPPVFAILSPLSLAACVAGLGLPHLQLFGSSRLSLVLEWSLVRMLMC